MNLIACYLTMLNENAHDLFSNFPWLNYILYILYFSMSLTSIIFLVLKIQIRLHNYSSFYGSSDVILYKLGKSQIWFSVPKNAQICEPNDYTLWTESQGQLNSLHTYVAVSTLLDMEISFNFIMLLTSEVEPLLALPKMICLCQY